jgi:hypothetical protein
MILTLVSQLRLAWLLAITNIPKGLRMDQKSLTQNRGGCVVRRAALTISSNFSKILGAAGRSRFLTRSEKNSSNFSKVRDALHSSQISQPTLVPRR